MSTQRSSFRLVVLALATLAAPAARAQTSPRLFTVPTFRTVLPPGEIAIADFDADGRGDVAVVHPQHSSVEVLLSQPGGDLLQHALLVPGLNPLDVVAADFDGDGKPDLATANLGTGTLGVLRGLGGGDFAPAQPAPLGANPRAIEAGDMDGDGAPDVVALRSTAILVVHNAGGGTFTLKPSVPTNGDLGSLVLADFDADGHLDAAVGAYDGGTVFLNAGDGSFSGLGSGTAGPSVSWLAAADFDGDGFADLATANEGSDTVSVLLGLGDGNFPTPQDLGVGEAPDAVVALDLDEDGHADLASASGGDGTLSLLLGHGDGGFAPASTYGACYTPASLHVGDMDGDGHADLITVNQDVYYFHIFKTTSISIVHGRGDGTLRADTLLPNELPIYAVAAGDLDGDGRDDVVMGFSPPLAVKIGLGRGDGTFQDLGFFGLGQLSAAPSSLAVADVNADGALDVATADQFGDAVELLLGHGDGTVAWSAISHVGDDPQAVAVGDFDSDGFPDLASADLGGKQVSVAAAHGDGSLSPAVAWAVAEGPFSLALADYDADGDLDIAAGCPGGLAAVLLLNQGNASFTKGTSLTPGGAVYSLVSGDFDQNGKPDLAAILKFTQDTMLGVLVSHGNAHFTPKLSPLQGSPGSLVVLDADGDGRQDLAVTNGMDNTIDLLQGVGNANFTDAGLYGTGSGPTALAVGDFDTDGRPDIAVVPSYHGSDWSLRVSLNDAPSAWSKLGFALAGSHGKPVLWGAGPLTDGSANALHVAGGKANAVTTLVAGFAEAPLPFKGGTLVPSPTLLVPLATDGAGTLALPFTMPAGVPSGLTLVLQAWIADASAVHGLAATNALLGLVP